MSQQIENGRSFQQYKIQLQKIVDQKAGLAVSLLQLSARERQIISLLPTCTKQVTHDAYQSFLYQQCYLLLKITTPGQSIWLSDNVQLAQMSNQVNLQVSLQSQVHQLHDNLAKYETVIESLRQLKQMQLLEKEQQECNRHPQAIQLKLKKYIQNLEKEFFQAKTQIKNLNDGKMELAAELTALQQKYKSNEQLREFQNRFKQCNEVSLSQPPKRRHKKMLINF